MDVDEVISFLREHGSEENAKGMARYGIVSSRSRILGVPKPVIRKLAKRLRSKDPNENIKMAKELWKTGIQEARILASIIADPSIPKGDVMRWIEDIDNWELCDQCVINLFWKLPYAMELMREMITSDEKFKKRVGYALIAVMSRKRDDAPLDEFEELVKKEDDKRAYVKKAVKWAAREIAKRKNKIHK